MKKDKVLFEFNDFEWNGINKIDYKTQENSKVTFRNVARQNIFESKDDILFDVRYFECGKDGHTTLEKHEHAHIVVILRGKGKVIIEDVIKGVKPFDLVVIPSWAKHQLINTENEPFGFVCTVNAVRDKAQLLTQQEVDDLRKIQEINQHMKITEDYFNF